MILNKGQGRNQAYWEFLVHGEQLQAPIPIFLFKKIMHVKKVYK